MNPTFTVVQNTGARNTEGMTFVMSEDKFTEIVPHYSLLVNFCFQLAQAIGANHYTILPYDHGLQGISPKEFSSENGSTISKRFNRCLSNEGQYYPMVELGTIYVADNMTPQKTVNRVKEIIDNLYPGLIVKTLDYVNSSPDSAEWGWS